MDGDETRMHAEKAWIEYVTPLAQKLWFDSERERWIAKWIREHAYEDSDLKWHEGNGVA